MKGQREKDDEKVFSSDTAVLIVGTKHHLLVLTEVSDLKSSLPPRHTQIKKIYI